MISAIGKNINKNNFLHQYSLNINCSYFRDLKPENFLFEDKDDGALIKLIDFGLSTSYLEQVKDSDGRSMKVLTKLKTCAGTSLYMAPEVIMK
jgi:serine/threonine protein kinase